VRLLLTRTGPYARSKFKVLSLLDVILRQSQQNGDNDYLSIKRLAIFSGVSYYSLASLLRRYVYFGYIKSRACAGEGRSEYIILAKGQKWLRRAESDLPNARQFIQELSGRIDKTVPMTNDLLMMPFKDFLKSLSAPDKGGV
jgi:DNA-binding PadR family transcriptional regulator